MRQMANYEIDDIKIVITGEDKGSKKTIQDQVTQLKKLDAALNKLNQAATKLNGAHVTSYFKMLDKAFKTMDVRVSAKAIAAMSKISSMGNMIKRSDGEKYKSVAEGIREILKATEGLDKVDAGKLASLATLAQAGRASANRAARQSGARRAKDGTISKGVGTAESADVGEQAKAVDKAAFSWEKFVRAVNKGLAPLKKIKAHLKSVAKHLLDFAKFAASNNSLVRGFSSIAKAAGGMADKLKRGISDVMRIVKYRAIRSAIKAITQGFTEGLKNAYQYAKLTGNQFEASMNQIATASNYVKNSLGAMAMPIINTLAPAIDYLANKFVDLLNFINEVIAALTGAKTWTKAIKNPAEWGEATEDAAGKAKRAMDEYKNTILGIDEINPLNGVNDSGTGGGGGGGGGADYASMFETQEVTRKMKDFLANWGTELAKKINEGIAKISKALDKLDASKYTKKFVKQLNNLNNGIKWSNLGKLIGKGINKVVDALLPLYKDFNYKKLGSNLAKTINSAIGTINTEKIGKLLGAKYKAFWNTSLGFVSEFDFSALGRKIASGINGYFKEHDLSIKTKTLAKFINGGFAALKEITLNVDWGAIVKDIATGFNTFISEFNWKENGVITGDFLANAISALADIISKTDWESLFKGIGEYASEAFKKVGPALGKLAKALWNALVDAIKGLSATDIGKLALAIAGLKLTFQASKFAGWATSLVKGISGSLNTTANAASLSTGFSGLIVSALALVGINEIIQDTLGKGLRDAGYLDEDDNTGKGWLNGIWDQFAEHVVGNPLTIKTTFTLDDNDNYFTPLMRLLGLEDPYTEGDSGGGASRSFDVDVNVDPVPGWAGNIADWIEGLPVWKKKNPKKEVELKQGWTGKVSDWIESLKVWKKNPKKEVDLKKGWTEKNVAEWLKAHNWGGDPTKKVGLEKGWSTPDVAAWIRKNYWGESVYKPIYLSRGSGNNTWDNVRDWIRKKLGSGDITIPIDLDIRNVDINTPGRAMGGTVASGQLFVARENGLPEMVGSFGNQTGVANNDQIIEGITQGVAAGQAGQNRLLQEQNALLRAILSKESGSSDVVRALNATNARVGHALV